jgi:hypothetical protein
LPQNPRYNKPGQQVLFSAYHLSDATARSHLDKMRESGAAWIHGYPSVIALAARYALELGHRPTIRWVTLGAETVVLPASTGEFPGSLGTSAGPTVALARLYQA